MNGKHVGRILALGAALLVGCDGGDDTPSNPPATPSTPAPTTPDVTPKAEDGGAGGIGATAPSATTDPTAADAGAVTTTTPDPKAGSAAGSTEQDEAAAKVKEANEHLAATIQHLKDNKPDLARESLRKAEAMQDGLPTTVREQIKTMRANVDKSSKSEDLPSPTGDDEENK